VLRNSLRLDTEAEREEARLARALTRLGAPIPATAAAAIVPAPATAPPPPAPTLAPTGKAVGKKGAVAAVPQGDVLLSRPTALPETSLIVPVLLHSRALDAAAAAALAAPVAAAKGPAKGGKAGAAGASGAGTVLPSDLRFSTHLKQLALLSKAYARLDKRAIGAASASDIAAAFAAELRSVSDRSDAAVTAWIASRDLNADGAISWPEFAASFGGLFLPPGSGVTLELAKSEADSAAAAAVAALASHGAAAGGKGKPAAAAKGAHAATAVAPGLQSFDTDPVKLAAAMDAGVRLGAARRNVERELRVAATAAVGQISAILHASLPAGPRGAIEETPLALASLHWAPAVLDVIAGVGLLSLFTSRAALRKLLTGWTTHITAIVSAPTDERLWAFRVTHGETAADFSASTHTHLSRAASVAPDATRAADMTIAHAVATAPGMAILLRGFGFEPVFQDDALGEGVTPSTPVEYRLFGPASREWLTLPETARTSIAAAAGAVARHAVLLEAPEAADPAAVVLGVAALLLGGSRGALTSLVSALATRPPLPPFGGTLGGASAPAKAAAKGKGAGTGVASTVPKTPKDAAGDGFVDALVDVTAAARWRAVFHPLEQSLTGVSAAPNDVAKRRVTLSAVAGAAHVRNFGSVPVPAAAQSDALWDGAKTYAASGWREMADGALVLPVDVPIGAVASRALEITALYPLLNAVDALRVAQIAARKAMPDLPSLTPGVKDAPPAPSRIPTSLLTAVLEPVHALSRRYSESNALRGSDRLPEGSSRLNASAAAALGGALDGADASNADDELQHSLSTAPADNSFLNASALTAAPADAESSAHIKLPVIIAPSAASQLASQPGSRASTPGPVTERGAVLRHHTTATGAALVALGPEATNDVLARLREDGVRERAAAVAREVALSGELKELRAQVRAHTVDELVPRLKAALKDATGDANATVRASVVAASMGLGMKVDVADVGAKGGTAAAAATPAHKPGAAAAAGKSGAKGGASGTHGKIAHGCVGVIASPLRLSSPAFAGATTVTVRCHAGEWFPGKEVSGGAGPAGGLVGDLRAAEEAAAAAAAEGKGGVPFFPRALSLGGGDWVQFGGDASKGAEAVFVVRAHEGVAAGLPVDEVTLELDRPLAGSHDEGTFVVRGVGDPAARAALERAQLRIFAQRELLSSIIASAVAAGEASIVSRAAEAAFIHRCERGVVREMAAR
jgi:hypothetical protein